MWLTFEYILRLVTSPHLRITLTSLLNIIHLVTLSASWTYLVLADADLFSDDPFFHLKFFHHLALVRLFRFFHLCRYVKSLRILLHGIERAFQDILSIGLIILLFVFTFGVIIQVIEKNDAGAHVTRFEDLFNIVTISTITVGDAKRVPLSVAGRIVCSILAALGNGSRTRR